MNKELATAVVISQFLVGMPVFAGGFQLNETSPSLQGSAMAGAAAAFNDVSAQFNNPATLSALTQNQVYLGASEFLPQISMFDGQATHTFNVPGMPNSNIPGRVLGDPAHHNIHKSAFIPQGYLGWRTPLDKLSLGLAVVEPFYLYNNYSEDTVLRFSSVKSEIDSVDIIPSISYQVLEQLSLGVGFQAQYLNTHFSHFDGMYVGYPPIDMVFASTHPSRYNSNGWGYGYTVGGLYQYDKLTRLGISYRSGISTSLRGNGKQFTIIGDIVPSPADTFPFNSETSVRSHINTPGVLSIGIARDINQQWTFKGTAQVNFWNTFRELKIITPEAYETVYRVPMNWQNTFFGSIGADYRYNDALTLRAGFAYDQTPTSFSNRSPIIPDSDQLWLNFGLTYLVTKHFSIDGAYSHIFIREQPINITQVNEGIPHMPAPLEINQVSAEYKGTNNIFSLGLRYSC